VIPFSLFPFPFSLGIVRGLRREGEIVFTYLLLAAGLFHPLAVEIFEIQKKARYLFRISKKTPRSINYGGWGVDSNLVIVRCCAKNLVVETS
jgi:hypothetical protein